MKKTNRFITIFITIHLILIFLHIHKNTLFIKNNYKQQMYEKKINALLEKKESLIQNLHAMKDRETIKKYAHHTLHMKPYTLKQVKKIVPYDTNI